MKEKIILAIGLGLLILGIQTRLFGTQTASKPPAALGTIMGNLVKNAEVGVVTRVIDGDTIVVTVLGKSEKVRLIGIDTPETVDPRKPVQCFGKEASSYVSILLLNKSVNLENDPSQGDKDKYGRLLRYVYLGDANINQKIITEGYGHEYTYNLPHKYQTDFKKAEQFARETKSGLWSDNACVPIDPAI